MSIKISFADLTHTGQVIAANTFPYGISLVAAYAKQKFGDEIDVEIFKYPDDFSGYLKRGVPQIACFSNYLWNTRLSYAYAERIKKKNPEAVIVFGGPTYPGDESEQRRWLEAHPAVDFYVWLEGERAFSLLLERLIAADFNVAAIKEAREPIGSVHYIAGDTVVRGEALERISELDEIPSPYLLGLLEKFFDPVLIPMIEMARGCPFQCTFCEIGRTYFNKVRRHSFERLHEELYYIADRAKTPDLLFSDSNFGMYREDLDICRILADLRQERKWPKYVANSSGKNQKERVLEAARILDGAMVLTVSIQTADEKILENVKRKNISLDQIVAVGKSAEETGANSYCEIILGLPGDSREAHFRSVASMVDANINDVMMYQAMMLPGSEISDAAYRERFGLVGRFRVLPRCFGFYDMLGEQVGVVEMEEICVSQNSLSYEDYLVCRALDLSVELFHNGGVFRELCNFLNLHGVPTSQFLVQTHAAAFASDSGLAAIYDGYMRENDEKLWKRQEELERFVAQPDIIARYISGELGSSELYKYKAIAFFQYQEDLHRIAFATGRRLLEDAGALSDLAENYLTQLKRFSLLRKDALLDGALDSIETFDFDFVALMGRRFEANPADHTGRRYRLRIRHTDEQRQLIEAYIRQYGTSTNGLGRFLLRTHVNKLYRGPSYLKADVDAGAAVTADT